MTDAERARRAQQLAHGAIYPYRLRPNSPRWNEFDRLLTAIQLNEPDPDPEPEPPPPPPPPGPRLAPRTYNVAPNGSDPRFCVHAPGVIQVGSDRYRDEGGHLYTADGLNTDGGNWRNRDRMVPGLKPSNEMDGRSACDPYGPFPPWPAESYER